MQRMKKSLVWFSALVIGLLLAWSSGAIDQPTPTSAGDAAIVVAVDSVSAGGLDALGLGALFWQEPGFIGCALDFSCTMECQATQHACLFSCGSDPACQQACIDEGERCAATYCCL